MMSHPSLLLMLALVVVSELSSTSRLAAQMELPRKAKREAAQEASVLVAALESDDDRIRIAATDRLVEMGSDAVPALRKAIRHWNPRVYQAAAETLADIGPGGVPVLIEGLASENTLLRTKCADAIFTIGEGAVPELCEVLRHGTVTGQPDVDEDDSLNRRETTIVRRFTSRQLPELRREYSEASLRLEAARVLRLLGDKAVSGIPCLVEALYDSDAHIRDTAGEALQRIGVATIPALRDVLKRDNPQARCVATRVLGAFGQRNAELALELGEATRDNDVCVRMAAVEALCVAHVPLQRSEAAIAWYEACPDAVKGKIDVVAEVVPKESTTVIATLQERLADSNHRVRLLAVLAVSRIGQIAAGAERRAGDESVDVIVKKATEVVVKQARADNPSLPKEDEEALAGSTEASLRESVEKVLQDAVAANRGARAAAETALRQAAEGEDVFVSVAGATALRKLAAKIPRQP